MNLFSTYFVLALRRLCGELCGSYTMRQFSLYYIVHEASYYAYELNDSGRSAQYRSKSRCLHRFQWSWRIVPSFEAK